MPQTSTFSGPSSITIQRPRCSKCQASMMLARIEPGPRGSDQRTFDCSKCGYTLRVLVEDPKKCDDADWLDRN
jgi:ribosomal protein S27AE